MSISTLLLVRVMYAANDEASALINATFIFVAAAAPALITSLKINSKPLTLVLFVLLKIELIKFAGAMRHIFFKFVNIN